MLYRSLFRIIGRENKVKLALLQIIFLVTALFQVAGIASIAPFIAMVSDTNAINNNRILSILFNAYDFQSNTQFMITYAIGVVFLLLIGNAISSFSTWKLFQVSVRLGAYVQKNAYDSYLNNDYTFFAMNNSNRLISQITQEIPRMVYMVVQPLLNLISQLFIATLIIIGLLLIDIKIALIATAIVLAVYFLIFKIIRAKVVEYGKLLTKLNQTKLKLLDESIAGIKEVKLKGNESFYCSEVDQVTKQGLSATAYISLAGDLPRYVVETVIFSSILGLSIFILLTSGTASEALGIISLYAMAGYKLLPAAQAIYKAYSQIKANGSVVTDLDNEIEESRNHISPLKTLGNEPAPEGDVTFDNVSFTYPGTVTPALQECSFSILSNKITAFIGESGAGKSTAVDLVLGLMLPQHGKIAVGNKLLDQRNIKSWRQRIGYVAQDIFILDASIEENIAFGIPKEEVNIDQLILAAKMANIYDFITQCEGEFQFKVGERGAKLSGGQKQRIGIARALYKDPSILVFDEATSALDNVTERLIMKDILSLASSRTIVMIAHRLTTVEKADSILLFKNGKVEAQGSYEELANSSKEFQALLTAGASSSIEAVEL
ncbi:ABC transporter ATP-binding protein [Saccharospirillum alexandrii]|uniref:ABC transporter ATP-binding protein n=1 Tax=Saccharospirillum alexandrii TaxID=2448477 RepID=UPI000FD9BF06|nr:ABC transporter ATP-binding protein [Saccharospirillum alexandrii]